MNRVSVFDLAGEFAENKDAAREIRESKLRPVLESGQEIVLDFDGVGLTTQSFIHALLSELIRSLGPDILDRVQFKNCNTNVQGIIMIVIEYSQDSYGEDEDEGAER